MGEAGKGIKREYVGEKSYNRQDISIYFWNLKKATENRLIEWNRPRLTIRQAGAEKEVK